MTALAHESRNAIQRGQAYLERLSWRLQDRPEELALLGRGPRRPGRPAAALRERPRVRRPAPARTPRRCDLRAVWRRAWATLESVWQRPGRPARRGDRRRRPALPGRPVPPRAGLPQHLRQRPGRRPRPGDASRSAATRRRCEGRPAVRLSVRDNGPGLNAEQRRAALRAVLHDQGQGDGPGHGDCTPNRRGPRRPDRASATGRGPRSHHPYHGAEHESSPEDRRRRRRGRTCASTCASCCPAWATR